MPFRQARKQPPPEAEEEASEPSETGPQPEAGEAPKSNEKYRSDGTVLQELVQFGAEESLAAPPPDFVPYGSATGARGDGLRRGGPFQQMYQNPFSRFVNIQPMPFVRFAGQLQK